MHTKLKTQVQEKDISFLIHFQEEEVSNVSVRETEKSVMGTLNNQYKNTVYEFCCFT